MFEFRHPHIETQINDNSYVDTSSGDGSNSSILFQPYFSEKGEDNVIKKYSSVSDFLAKNGTPNFKKHGQGIYNLTQWLTNGPVYGMRLLPEDATFANMVLSFGVKENKTVSGTEVVLVTRAQSIENLRDSKEFSTGINNLDTVIGGSKTTSGVGTPGVSAPMKPVTPNGTFTDYNFIGFRVKGRGNYGNNYSIRIKSNTAKSKATEYRCYDLTIFSTNASGTTQLVEGQYSVSFNPDAINLGGSSLFVEEIINSYSEIITCEFNEEKYAKYIAKLAEVVPDFNANKFDFLFCKDENLNDYNGVSLFAGSTAIDQTVGVYLADGTDGKLDKATTQTERLEIMNDLYKEAFAGTINNDVFNKKAFPFDVVLDANYPILVKNQMKTFCETRQDVFPYFDCGLAPSYSSTAAINYRKTEFDADTYLGALFAPSRKVKDPYGIGYIEVTFTYVLAGKIPAHDLSFGVQRPIAGPNYGIVGTFAEGDLSFNPDEYQQEDLYNSQINYVTQDYDGTGEIGTQLTLQKKLSSLSDINNVRSLLKIVRQIENVAAKYRFEFSDETTLALFQGDLDAVSVAWIDNRACSNLSLSVTQSDYDKAMKTAKVNVDIVFTGVIESISIQVNVGR